METFSAFEYAVASTAEIIKGTGPDQGGLPTPCAEWDVRALLSHVIGTLWLCEALFTGQAPRYPMIPGGLPATDPVGDDPVAAYAEASAAALAAVGAGRASAAGGAYGTGRAGGVEGAGGEGGEGDALSRVHVTPLGEMPGSLLAGFTILDIAVHGWDLARATGQPADLDGRLAAHVLAFAEQTLATPETRGPRIGPARPVPADAPVTQRLAAFLGRDPH